VGIWVDFEQFKIDFLKEMEEDWFWCKKLGFW